MTARRSILAHTCTATLAARTGACLAAMLLIPAMVGMASAQTSPPPATGAATMQPASPSAPGAAPGQPTTAPVVSPPAPATAPPASPRAAGLTLPPQPPPPGLAGPPTEQRGFLNGFSKWWDQSVADWKAKMKEQQTKLDDFNKQSADAAKDAAKNAATATQQAMKSAADALRPSHVIEIQQTCPLAGNGAADCATAATNVCKAKGFSGGQPLDVRTAEKCADSLWVSGQAPTAADCPVETVLLRAACQ